MPYTNPYVGLPPEPATAVSDPWGQADANPDPLAARAATMSCVPFTHTPAPLTAAFRTEGHHHL